MAAHRDAAAAGEGTAVTTQPAAAEELSGLDALLSRSEGINGTTEEEQEEEELAGHTTEEPSSVTTARYSPGAHSPGAHSPDDDCAQGLAADRGGPPPALPARDNVPESGSEAETESELTDEAETLSISAADLTDRTNPAMPVPPMPAAIGQCAAAATMSAAKGQAIQSWLDQSFSPGSLSPGVGGAGRLGCLGPGGPLEGWSVWVREP